MKLDPVAGCLSLALRWKPAHRLIDEALDLPFMTVTHYKGDWFLNRRQLSISKMMQTKSYTS